MSMKPINDVQICMCEVIYDFTTSNGLPPINRDIGRGMIDRGWKFANPDGDVATSKVEYQVSILERRGYVTRELKKARTFKLTKSGIELVKQRRGIGFMEGTDDVEVNKQVRGVLWMGYIAAGELCEESSESGRMINAGLELDIRDLSALTVKGNSMIEAGILDGDDIFVKKQPRYENGDIVVAFHAEQGLPGGFTLKRFYQEKNYVRLQPANSEVHPRFIHAYEWSSFDEWSPSWEIQGKFVKLVRNNIT